jgi:hypothetical protein
MRALAFQKWKSLLTEIADDGSAEDGSDRAARVEGVCAGTVSAGLSLLDGQDLNKIFDVCSLLKLVRCGAQNLFDFGYRTRELFS